MDTRPTPDRLRETLFDIISPRIQELNARPQGMVFADLFAGTGAVGIEALSRGARKAIFVESNRAAAQVIRENLHSLGLDRRAELHQGRVRAVEADIIFIDPPYNDKEAYDRALNAVSGLPPARTPELVIVQHDVRMKLAEAYGSLHHTRTVKQGDNCLSFFETATIKENGAESDAADANDAGA